MKISYNLLKEYFKNLPKPEKVAQLLTLHSFEVKEFKKEGQDFVFDLELPANRPDCFGHLGIVQELAAILGRSFKLTWRELSRPKKQGKFFRVKVKDVQLCPRYCAVLMTDLKVKPSPKFIQDRLKACGLRPINNIVDATNYVMLETGQPLHAFDYDKINKTKIKDQRSKRRDKSEKVKEIIVRRAKKGERIVTLDGEEYELDRDILIIADQNEPLAIAGIKGGKKAEITKETKTILLESANFEPHLIRRASRKLGLRTEASWRFEHHLSPALTWLALGRLVELIQKIAGGEVKEIADFYPRPIRPKRIKLSFSQVNRLLGLIIPPQKIKGILQNLGLKIIKTNREDILVEVPLLRKDLLLPEDLIEEIGRIYGYESIPVSLPRCSVLPPQVNQELVYQNKIKDILVGLGWTETYNYSFISEKQKEIYHLDNLVEIANPLSGNQKYLRPSLTSNLLKNVQDNFRFFSEVRLFEIGKVFYQPKFLEKKRLGIVFGLKENRDLRLGSGFWVEKGIVFYRLKGLIDTLLNKLGLTEIWYDDVLEKEELQRLENRILNEVIHPLRRAQIKIGDNQIGWLGEVKPEILEKLDLEGKVAIAEMDLVHLIKLAEEEKIYQPPVKYPAVVRDIALLVEPDTKVVKVLNLINAVGGKLVRDVDLFDIYEGENIPEGKKSLAFHIIYQADDHTLTDEEVEEIHQRIIQALEEEGGWEVRK